MEHVRFGRTGLKVSRLCLGGMSLGSSAWKGWVLDEPASIPILRRALDLGINFFDTADWYSLGRSEEVIGRNLLKMAPRDELVLATKVFYPMSGDPNDRGLSRRHILNSIDRSLKRLGTDHVDLYIAHAFDPEAPIEETMKALHDVVRAGKARYLGASTMYAWQFAEMNAVARQNGWTPFVNMQCQLSLLYREEEREMMPYCDHRGVAVTTFSPLARGYLAAAPSNARTVHDPYLEWFGDEIDREIARRVSEIAGPARRGPGRGGDGLGRWTSRRDCAADRGRCAGPGRRRGLGCGNGADGRRAVVPGSALSSARYDQRLQPRAASQGAGHSGAGDMIFIGEAFEGAGANAAHINLILGDKQHLGGAFALAAASPGPGHVPFQAVLKPNLPAKPTTLFVAKAVLRDGNHERMTWGPAQAGVAAGVTHALVDNVLPPGAADDWLAIALVWVDPAADDAEAVYANNRAAALEAAARAMQTGRPSRDELIAGLAEVSNPFFTPAKPA